MTLSVLIVQSVPFRVVENTIGLLILDVMGVARQLKRGIQSIHLGLRIYAAGPELTG